MDAKNLKVGFNTFISITMGVVSAMTVWFTLQGEVSLLRAKVNQMEKVQEKEHTATERQFREVHSEYKELTKTLNKFKFEILKAIQEKQ